MVQITAYVVLDHLVVQATAMTTSEGGAHSWERLVFETWPLGGVDPESGRDVLGEVTQCVLERLSAIAQDGPPPWA